MTIHLCTFSDESMSRARDLCVRSAILKGGIGSNEIHSYNTWDIRTLAESHPKLFADARGCGYWSWKPYLIDQLTGPTGFARGVDQGDVIIYADAGVEFINNVSHIIERMDQDIFLFGNNWEHAHWCKRDVIEAVWPYDIERDGPLVMGDLERTPQGWELYYQEAALLNPWERFGKQVQASVIFFRVSDYSKQFVAEWLKWCLHRQRYSTICTDEWRYLIDDSPSIKPNHPEFREHRHDQAILTTLAYREGIKLHYWPASYNDGAFSYEKIAEYAGDNYPILFNHHRRRQADWEQLDRTRTAA